MCSVPLGLNIKLHFFDSFTYRSIFYLCGKRKGTHRKRMGMMKTSADDDNNKRTMANVLCSTCFVS